MARGRAQQTRPWALRHYVVRGALDRRRAGPERRTRRLQMAGPGRARRPQADGRPAGYAEGRQPADSRLIGIYREPSIQPARLASSALKRHITRVLEPA